MPSSTKTTTSSFKQSLSHQNPTGLGRSQSSIHSTTSSSTILLTRSPTYSNLLNEIRLASPSIHLNSNPLKELLMIDAYGTHSPIRKTLSFSIRSGKPRSTIIAYSILFILLWKWLIGLGSYSGYQSPPLFGDLEAQRHWMAVTVHVKLPHLYYFDLEYWGLDYPPLTAYHSFLLGHIAKFINPAFVLLRPPATNLNGWGHELHSQLKIFLRSSVLASEILLWIPTVLIYHFKACSFSSGQQHNHHQRLIKIGSDKTHPPMLTDRLWLGTMYSILVVLLNTNLILIDNGHFQFNSIMLGFTLASVSCFYSGRDLLGAIMFICSLAFKQMALYYSPAIFAYLFGKCLYLGHPNGTKLFIQLAIISTGMVGILFGPFIFSSDFPQLIVQVLERIFPIGRGLFEDKVGNFWCTLNLIIKIRTLGSVKSLANIALLVTIGAVLPGILIVIILSRKLNLNRSSSFKLSSSISNQSSSTRLIPKTIDLLPFTLFNSSIGFYLFSFQVHEKSILLPVLPLLLILSQHHQNLTRDSSIVLTMDWDIICLISNVSIFSMWPLLKRDQLGIQYLVSIFSYNHMIGYSPLSLMMRSRINLISLTILAIYIAMIGIHVSEKVIKPPDHLPDIFVVMNLTLSFTVFFASYVWSLIRIYEGAWALNGFRMLENQEKVAISKEVEDDDQDNRSMIDYGRSESSFLDDELEEFRVKLPAKRSTSLQQHGSRRIQSGSQSESELEELKSRSVGASSGLRLGNLQKRMLKDSRPGSRSGSKAMITSPSGEKLMNRIKNRLQLEASRSQSRSRSRSSQGSTSQERNIINVEIEEAEQQQQQQQQQQQEEDEADDVVVVPLQSQDKENKQHQETHQSDHILSSSPSNDFNRHGRVENAWEVALRQSREEAIRRRREELLITRNHR